MQPQNKRKRHVPVHNAQHVYWSERANGTKVYEVRFPRNADGKRLYETVGPRLEDAKQRAREVHGLAAPRVASVATTLNQVIESWRETRELRPRSVESFDTMIRLHIAPRFGRVKVRDIDKHAIMAWLNGLTRKDGRPGPLASGTRRLILATLQILLAHAVEMDALGAVPRLDRKRRPKAGESRRRVLSRYEEVRLLAYCAPFAWLRPIITVSLHQALRLGEVAGLQWEDVDFAAGKLHVRRSLGRDGTLGLPKGGRAASIELTPATREALLELRQDSDGTGFVFVNSLGAQRQMRDIQRAFTKARDRAALPVTDDGAVCFHSLRHTGISRLANHPAIPLVHVRDFARHTDLAVTQGYVHRIESEAVTVAIGDALAQASA
jgi:integrase